MSERVYRLSARQVEIVRLALHGRADRLRDCKEQMSTFAETLRAGTAVPPFPPGLAGAKVAEEMADNFRQQREQVAALLSETFVYEDEEEEEEEN